MRSKRRLPGFATEFGFVSLVIGDFIAIPYLYLMHSVNADSYV